MSANKIREVIRKTIALGAGAIRVSGKKNKVILATTSRHPSATFVALGSESWNQHTSISHVHIAREEAANSAIRLECIRRQLPSAVMSILQGKRLQTVQSDWNASAGSFRPLGEHALTRTIDTLR